MQGAPNGGDRALTRAASSISRHWRCEGCKDGPGLERAWTSLKEVSRASNMEDWARMALWSLGRRATLNPPSLSWEGIKGWVQSER